MKVDSTAYTIENVFAMADSTTIGRTEQYRIGYALPDRGFRDDSLRYSAENDDFIVGAIIIVFIFFAVVISRGRLFLAYQIKGFFADKRRYMDENIKASSAEVSDAITLTGVACFSLSLIAYEYMADVGMFDNLFYVPYWIFGLCFVGVLAFIMVKVLLYAFINWIFFDAQSGRKWISSYFLLISLSSFLVFPISLVTIFLNISYSFVAFCLLFVLILYEILVFYKLCANFKTKKCGVLLIFLYFCAVEIMPSLVVWHFLNTTKSSIVL